MKKIALPLMVVITLVSLGVGLFSFLRWRPSRPAVTVGGERISEFDYKRAMEIQAGPAVMKKLVYTDLVRQAATQQNVLPTTADVDARLAVLTVQKPELAAAMKNADSDFAKQTRTDLTTDLALENLRIKGITASDAEVNAFYYANRAGFVVQPKLALTLVVAQNSEDASAAEHLLSINAAPEVIARSPRLHVAGINGFNINFNALDPTTRTNVQKTFFATGVGQIKTLPLGNMFLIYKITHKTPAVTQPLSQVRDQVVRLVKLKKAVTPQQELASLYAATPPSFNNDRYKAYFSDIEQFNAQNAGKKKVASNP